MIRKGIFIRNLKTHDEKKDYKLMGTKNFYRDIKLKIEFSGFTLRPICLAFLVSIILINYSCQHKTNIKYEILNNKNSFYYIDVKNYPSNRRILPVGIFDSGTGGLAVMNDILEFKGFKDSMKVDLNPSDSSKIFKNESFIYLGDLANMPYGSYALENNTELLIEHIFKDVQFLLGNKYYQAGNSVKYNDNKEPVKAIVIACNTATAYGLDSVRNFIKEASLDIEVIGVIEAGASAAVKDFSSGESGSIAVLATDGTVQSGAYVSAIELLIKNLNLKGDIQIFQHACIGIAEAVDQNQDFIVKTAIKPRDGYKGPSDSGKEEMLINLSLWNRYDFNMSNGAMLFEGDENSPQNLQINSVENYISFHLVSLMEKLRKEKLSKPLKSVILGCTHYPFFNESFRETLARLREYTEEGKAVYKPYISENVVFINPGIYVADQLYDFLKSKDLLNTGETDKNEFYVSVPNVLNKNVNLRPEGSFTYEYKYGRKAGEIQEYVKMIPFSRLSIPDEILIRLSSQIPVVYDDMINFNYNNSKTGFLNVQDKILPVKEIKHEVQF